MASAVATMMLLILVVPIMFLRNGKQEGTE
jgi:putrescine transport system permease protein